MRTIYALSLILTLTFSVKSQTTWKMVSAGTEYGFALRSDSTLWCWGFNGNGQLGTGNPGTDTPVQMGTEHSWVRVACGAAHTLAIKADGTLWGWGYNYAGVVGNSGLTQVDTPNQIGTDQDWVYISAGLAHSAGIKSNGTLWMWGDNSSGQLGNGTNTSSDVPIEIAIAGIDMLPWSQVSLGAVHTLALKSNGTLYTWGNNSQGQLGNNTQVDSADPVQIGVAAWKNVSAGFAHSTGVQMDSTAWSWGFNGNGQLGQGDLQPRFQPTQIGNGDSWDRIIAGSAFTYGLALDNQLWSWGYNGQGQLGIGTQQQQTSPSPVANFFATSTSGLPTLALSVGSTNAAGTLLYGAHAIGIAVDNYSICSVGANYQGQLGLGSTSASSAFQCGVGDLSAVEVIASSLINVSPNPASGEIHVEVESAHSTCVIRDLSGRIVGEYSLQSGSNTLDIASFLPGTYLFDINGSVKKIIIQ